MDGIVPLQEAEVWLESAKRTIKLDKKRKFPVAVAQCAHALIRANDALCLKFLKGKPSSHDDALSFFRRIYTIEHAISGGEGKIGRKILLKWVKGEKAKAEYGKEYYSKSDALKAIRDTEMFLRIVRKYIRG